MTQITTTLSGGLAINGGTFNLSAGSSSGALSMTTDGTYNLINYAGSDTIAGGNNDAALNADLRVGNPVYGLTYNFHDTGAGVIQLLVTGVAATSSNWITDGSSSWATAANWSSSAIPNSIGSAAIFAGQAATHNQLIRSVTLDGNETVGTVFFDSPNGESYLINQGTGGSLIFNTGSSASAAITANAGSHYIYAPVSLSSNLDINTIGTSTLTIGGNMNNATGTNTLTKDGTGTLVLAGSNTYGPAAGTVGTTINAGTVRFSSSGAFSTGDIAVTSTPNPVTLQAGAAGLTVGNNINLASGLIVTVDTQAYTSNLSGTISGAGSAVTKIGSGTLILSGPNSYTGTTTISAGTLQLGNAGVGGYVSGNILDNSALVLNRTDDYALGNIISGTGTLTQNGTDNVTLNGSNTFTGNTVISAGTLTTGNALALQNSTLNYNGQGGNISFGTLTAVTLGGFIGGQSLALTNSTPAPVALTIQGAGTNTYTGTLSGGGSLTMIGSGTETIGSGASGGANYSGGTTVANGTLVLGGVTQISDGVIGLTGLNGVSNLTIADSAQVNSSSTLYLEDLPLNQGATQFYPASSNLLVKGNSQLTVAGLSIGLPGGTRVASSTVTVQDSATLTVNGAFNLESTAGTTASTNVVNLNGGTLATQNFTLAGGNGTTQLARVRLNGGVLKALAGDPSGSQFIPNTLGINTYVDGGGAIINTNSFNDTIATSLQHGTITTGGTTDGGLTKTGAGVLSLTTNATYTGPTVISGGTLRLAVPGPLVAAYSFDNTTATPTGSPSTISNSGNGGSAMDGTVNTVVSGVNIVSGGPTINGVSGNALQFTGDGSSVVINSGITNLSSAASWTVSTWIQTTEAGATIFSKNSTGATPWTTGNSIFYLSNASTGTTASPDAGTVPSAVRYAGGFMAGAATANVSNGAWHMVTYVDNAGTKSIYIDGVLSALSQTGFTTADVGNQVLLGYAPDTVAADGTYQLSGNLDDLNFFNTALTAGQISSLMATNKAFGSTPNTGVNTLAPTTAVNITTSGSSLDVNGTIQTIASLSGVAGTSVTLGGGQLTVGDATSTLFAGNITDSGGALSQTGGSLTKQGAGMLTLSGSNTYNGPTTITAGTLKAGSTTALSSASAFNVSGGTLDASSYANTIAGLTVSPTGALILGLGNVLTVSSAPSFAGTLNISSGTPSSLPEILISYTGGYSGAFTTTFGIPTGDALSYTSGALELISTATGPSSLIWAGGTGNWNTTDTNWTNASTLATGQQYSDISNSTASPVTGDSVAFNDGSGVYNVTINSASVHPTSVTFNNSLNNYNISGSGVGIAGAGSVTLTGTGTVTLSSSNTYTGGTFVNAGKLVLASANAFPAGTLLNVSSGATVQIAQHSGGSPYVPSISVLNNGGTIDITNNALVIKNANGSIGTISSEIAVGYSGGAWNANSDSSHLTSLAVITSSTAEFDSKHLTAVGVATGLTSFEGGTVSASDVLIKYTYYGDALLTGSVTTADYAAIDNGFLTRATGWQNGDFNYDGSVNGSDYTLIDNAFNTQGAQLLSQIASPTAQIAGSGASSAVPEPTSLGLLGITAMGLLGRRNRRRK
jgi:autotransporter-associated beta strand protein